MGSYSKSSTQLTEASQAAALVLDARDAGISGIVAQILHFPMTCHPKFFPKDKYEYGSIIQNQASGVLGVIMMEAFLDAYLQDPVPDHRHSPLLATSLKDLPPARVFPPSIQQYAFQKLTSPK